MRNIPAGDEAESIRQERDSLFSLLGLTLSSGGDPLPMGEYRLKIDTSARGMETAVEGSPKRASSSVSASSLRGLGDRESRTENKGAARRKKIRGKKIEARTKRTIKTAEVPRRPRFLKAT